MRKAVLFILSMLTLASTSVSAQSVTYDAESQSGNMQYFTPKDKKQFVGDCIPFFHDGTYYLYWLLDEGHHSALGGLGGHQWCVSTTKDLVNWEHHPIAIGIDEEWEKSICTGSVAYYNNQFYAFYATRRVENGATKEQLSYAISPDALNFVKQQPNPFYTSAPGYSQTHFRDPKVVIDDEGVFHLFIASEQTNIDGPRGCLVHMTSSDLSNWEVHSPLIDRLGAVPECPDYFYWNGWYYLVFGQGLNTMYRKSREPYGPWEEPSSQALKEDWVNVAKTAAFPGGRRIAAGWIPSRSDGRDTGGQVFGGCSVLREVYQLDNGDLATSFPAELVPEGTETIPTAFGTKENATDEGETITIKNGRIQFTGIPRNCKTTLDIEPSASCREYGLRLRSNNTGTNGYALTLKPTEQTVTLARDAYMDKVEGLNGKISITVVMTDDIIDVDVDHRRCIVNRLPDQNGSSLWAFANNGEITISNVKIEKLPEKEEVLSEGTILPTYYLDKSIYSVTAMIFNDNISWDQWRNSHDGKTGIIMGTPPADSNGHQWYENNYQLTETGNRKWQQMTTPLGTGTWANDNITADIYMRRAFSLTSKINGRLMIKACFDDAPCEIYLNGHLLVAYPDGDPDGSLNATYLLTEEQQEWLMTDGSVNILAMHVHNDFGGSNADFGLYIADKPYTVLATHDYGTQFNNIVAADFFNDGQKELLIAGNDGNGVSRPHWLLKNNNGKWKDVGNPLNCTDRPSFSLCDFNGDGNLDVVCFENMLPTSAEVRKDRYSNDKGIFLGNGDGTFTKLKIEVVDADENRPTNFSRSFSVIYRIRSGAVADFNNDGLPDIVGIGYEENNVVLINQGFDGETVKMKPIYFDDGIIEGSNEKRGRSFSEAFVIPADFNNDGFTDFIVSANNWDYRQNTGADWERFTEVYLNNGNGDGFERTYWGLENPSVYNGGICVADFNNDGFLDIYCSGDGGYFPGTPKAIELTGSTTEGYWEYTMVCINDGTGHFKALPEESFDRHKVRGLNSVINTANAYDWDGDGYIDILHQGWCPQDNFQSGYIWLNNGNSSFIREYQYGGGSESSALLADWTGDGVKDILTAGWCENMKFVTHNYSAGRSFIVTECPEAKTLAPMAPQDLNVEVLDGKVRFSWTPAAEAPLSTTYEMYLKDSSNHLLCNCRAYISEDMNGLRKVEEFGNLGTNRSVDYTLADGDYTVGVQAVNGRRDGSPFTTLAFSISNGELSSISDVKTPVVTDRLYNLRGQVVGGSNTAVPQGVYINRGKKIVKQ